MARIALSGMTGGPEGPAGNDAERPCDGAAHRPDAGVSGRGRRLRRAHRRRHHQAALGAAAARARGPGSGAARAAHRAAQRPGAGDGDRLRPLLRSEGNGPALARRPRPARHSRGRMALAGARADPACRAVRAHPRRPLRPAVPAGIGGHTARAGVQRSLVPAPLPEPAAGGRIPAILRHRHRARERRALAGDRHPHRDARRDRLRARQPHGAHQCRGRHLRGVQGPAAGTVLRGDAGRAGAPRRPPRPCHRPADAGAAPQ